MHLRRTENDGVRNGLNHLNFSGGSGTEDSWAIIEYLEKAKGDGIENGLIHLGFDRCVISMTPKSISDPLDHISACDRAISGVISRNLYCTALAFVPPVCSSGFSYICLPSYSPPLLIRFHLRI